MVSARGELHRAEVGLRVGEGASLPTIAGIARILPGLAPTEEGLKRVLLPSEAILRHLSMNLSEAALIIVPPSSEGTALVHVGHTPLLGLPSRGAFFEGVVPKVGEFPELPEEFPLLVGKWIEAILIGVIHRRRQHTAHADDIDKGLANPRL
jgi:hypothetical protein